MLEKHSINEAATWVRVRARSRARARARARGRVGPEERVGPGKGVEVRARVTVGLDLGVLLRPGMGRTRRRGSCGGPGQDTRTGVGRHGGRGQG